jgi:hypothetical protein
MKAAAWLAAAFGVVLASSGCITVNGSGRTYVESSIPRASVRIQRVAILPNRLPANLQDPSAGVDPTGASFAASW